MYPQTCNITFSSIYHILFSEGTNVPILGPCHNFPNIQNGDNILTLEMIYKC